MSLYMNDNLHPNAKGMQVFKEYIKAQLQHKVTFVQEKDNQNTAYEEELSVLTIGNSYGIDSNKYLYDIFSDLGYTNIKIGDLYISGCSLERHYSDLQTAKAEYEYFETTNGTFSQTKNYSNIDALQERDWDFVILQADYDAGNVSDYKNIKPYVQLVKTYCPDAKIGWYGTWAWNEKTTLPQFAKYGSQNVMLDAINSNLKEYVETCEDIDFLIPVGSAIQNARASGVDDSLIVRDPGSYNHLNYQYGCYLAGMTYAKCILNVDIADINFLAPDVTKEQQQLIVDCINEATQRPYVVVNCRVGPSENPIDFSSMSYVAFGDSITYGADLIIGGRIETPYPAGIKNALGLLQSENKGVSGATLTQNTINLTCMTDVVTSYSGKADIISVLGGVNDYNRSLPLGTMTDRTATTIYGSLHVSMQYLAENYPDAFIFYMTPYKEYYNGTHWSQKNSAGYNLEEVAIAIKEVAAIYNIEVLDLFNTGNFESIMYDDDCDGIHPNQNFVTNFTVPQIAQFIRDNYS
ncbi:MAG: SGNH/GDSL hydrolase family protein, partial [Clostridia bacterium]|nr:SGNH/GDSL hydrolase family protein [Clostridia bacterium]